MVTASNHIEIVQGDMLEISMGNQRRTAIVEMVWNSCGITNYSLTVVLDEETGISGAMTLTKGMLKACNPVVTDHIDE